jgi:hypothetical protein
MPDRGILPAITEAFDPPTPVRAIVRRRAWIVQILHPVSK